MGKGYFIATYGCQANGADSERIAGLLEALGFTSVPAEIADLLVINSCTVRQAAEDKVYGWGRKVSQLKEKNARLKVVLTGCLVGAGDRSFPASSLAREKTPWVDFYLGLSQVHQLPERLWSWGLIEGWAVQALKLNPVAPKFADHAEVAYINVSQGCDNFCSFCVVPFTRGLEVSRSLSAITTEVDYALRQGFRRIMLLGQNVNSWGLEVGQKRLSRQRLGRLPFAALLRHLHCDPQLEKIKFLTSNPFDFSDDLIEALALPKIDRYLHLPVQSGDDEILRRMGRRHRREDYLDLVKQIRRTVPQIELGTDVIVGFPGETEEQFLKTADLVRSVRFNVVFASLYSVRPGTAAARLYPDDVPLIEKRRRHAYLTEIWRTSKPERIR